MTDGNSGGLIDSLVNRFFQVRYLQGYEQFRLLVTNPGAHCCVEIQPVTGLHFITSYGKKKIVLSNNQMICTKERRTKMLITPPRLPSCNITSTEGYESSTGFHYSLHFNCH